MLTTNVPRRGAPLGRPSPRGAPNTPPAGGAAGLLLEQPFGAEQLERLADGATADRELLRDLRLDEMLALTEAARQDLLADAVGGVFGERTRRRERREGVPVLHPAQHNVMSTVDRRRLLRSYSSPRARFIALFTSSMSKVIAKNPISHSEAAGP